MIVVQTNDDWKKVTKTCISTWLEPAISKGYDVKFIDYTDDNRSFIRILLDECINSDQKYVIVFFDDLYCTKFAIPSRSVVDQLFDAWEPDVVRLDGRVRPNGVKIDFPGGYEFFLDDKPRRYQFATVGTVFSANFLKKVDVCGVKSAWDLENLVEPGYKVFGMKVQTLQYRNLIVKGKIDFFSTFKDEFTLEVRYSLKRLMYRTIKKLLSNF